MSEPDDFRNDARADKEHAQRAWEEALQKQQELDEVEEYPSIEEEEAFFEEDKKKDYPYLRAWNKFLASPEEWNLQRAREDNVPQNVIHHESGHSWRTVDEIRNPETREQIERLAKEFLK